ncbi:MAG: hypothetical protein QW665_05425 [Metallosphaera sp.]
MTILERGLLADSAHNQLLPAKRTRTLVQGDFHVKPSFSGIEPRLVITHWWYKKARSYSSKGSETQTQTGRNPSLKNIVFTYYRL